MESSMNQQGHQENPQPGDLIEIDRVFYKDWAVSVGDDSVVHLAPNSGDDTKILVKKEKLQDVVNGSKWKIKNLLDDKFKPRGASLIVKEALLQVGTKHQYDVQENNCEHFATQLRYGKRESRQYQQGHQEEPKPGDLIEISGFLGVYAHWAVYVGNDMVVHMVLERTKEVYNAPVRMHLLKEAVGDCKWNINNLLDGKKAPREASLIVKKALEQVGTEQKYHILLYNCEHFATWLRYGIGESRQVQKAAKFTAGTSTAVAVGLAASLMRK